jgi:DNA adenine methylase
MVNARLDKTIIENKDFAEILAQYDDPQTFFYLDPPYGGGGIDYRHIGMIFTKDDHERLRVALSTIKGKFILSLNDSPENVESYENYNVKKISRMMGVNRKHLKSPEYKELIIFNFDLTEKNSGEYAQAT